MDIHVKEVVNGWKEFILSNNIIEISILNYGGIITKLSTPDRNGNTENIVWTFQDYHDYEKNSLYLGALIGRVSGRIPDGRFKINQQAYQLEQNEGTSHLHGGSDGFHQILWDTQIKKNESAAELQLTTKDIASSGGYPGCLNVTITYRLTSDNEFSIHYHAVPDTATILSLTNHTYFNLTGNMKNSVYQHHITMPSSTILELDNSLLPTGHLLNVTDTALDFRSGALLGEGLKSLPDIKQLALAGGYDHYFVFENEKSNIDVYEQASGRTLSIETNQPGMVMYTANQGTQGYVLADGTFPAHYGVCFETANTPSALYQDSLPTMIIQAGELYNKTTTFRFGIN
ncbi:aldose epimerase family protein [Oceanobacillus neutriphilus]|uniref:Aldose 1-epimerase n=1 Tax=Oceanobacillus neutriphilus TaxID=531815 RepID=A0ABQ2NYW2_9BACI|nr:aldose epimerase family protein [Oceanobacillus neutriphilus]GGP13946.1 aldose 1-epimerase [Oceanobacillus neutriphilus]